MKPSKIVNGIFQGGYPHHNPAEDGFDALVLCAEEYQPSAAAFPGVEVVYAPMADTQIDLATIGIAASAAARVADLMREGGARKVLVTCAAGRNRSGLVTGLLLHELYNLSGDTAISIIQGKRPGALSNDSFVEFLRELQGQ